MTTVHVLILLLAVLIAGAVLALIAFGVLA